MASTPSKKRSALWLLPAFLCAFSLGTPALAGEQEDFNAVYRDWEPDRQVTPCRFSRAELENADRIAGQNPDFGYLTDFQDEVQREIARWRANGCAGVSPASARAASPLAGLKIVSVFGRGGPSREVVRIRNTSRRTVSLRGATLRSRGTKRARFPSKFKLRPGRTARVGVGCAGHRRAWFRRLRVQLCRRTPLFKDTGDAARLVDAKGVYVSQRAYGSSSTLIDF